MNKQDLSRRGFLISSAAALAAAGVASAQQKPATTKVATTPSTKSPTTTEARGRAGRGERDRKSLSEIAATRKTKYSDLRVGIIGVDGRGAGNLRAIVETGATVAALCDIDSKNLEKPAAELKNAKTYADFREMLDKQGKDLDAVVISTPDHTHAPAAMMAMRMGKHVYCEKPLTYDIHEARTLADAARRYKIKTQM